MGRWLHEGKLTYLEDRFDGLDNAIAGLCARRRRLA